MERTRQKASKGGAVLTAVILCAVLAAWGSTLLAQQQEELAVAPAVNPVAIFDPFALRTIMVSSANAGGQPESPPGLENPNSRRPIRVPFRLPVRSAFKPGQEWKAL